MSPVASAIFLVAALSALTAVADDLPHHRPAASQPPQDVVAAPSATVAEASESVKPVRSEQAAPKAAPQVAPQATSEAEEAPTADAASNGTADANLRETLGELKQRRAIAAQMQQTLQANAALLRESTVLARVSRGKSRIMAERQVRESEQTVRDLGALMHQSRNDALLAAREAADQAREAEKAAELLSAEAVAQVRLFSGAGWVSPKKKAASPEVLLERRAGSAKSAKKDDKDDVDAKSV